jgi:hypothetical protein
MEPAPANAGVSVAASATTSRLDYHCRRDRAGATLRCIALFRTERAAIVPDDQPNPPLPVSRRADLLLLLPFGWQLGLAPWANGVAWRPLGLPFAMAWQMAGILFATGVLALRYALDGRGAGA